ncbi:electron transport complex subunit RsxC [Thiohalobacter sp. IOR34]|uniref:electron transport complex subunit RsxC n=1 Tax=Thiohalobacter sp. IOR34 TaxID=3057176 RepID=UPI0025B14B4A|nr:electron transport complex subunit RsxC [Thiohalobacter sp. IOR34]WJW76053.1 electron transport complex subunit RsxC [Thiohalobacter sp. IOR34]
MNHVLHRIHGGLHLEAHKAISTRHPVVELPPPQRLLFPLQQHIGEPAEPLVQPGERVLAGQMIARAHGYVSVPVHASSSGTVVEIADYPVPHPSGLSAPCIVIDTDGRDQWVDPQPIPDYRSLDPSELRNRIRDAGIVGLGGAGFPSFIKMNPGPDRRIELLVINGAECEPYITCDDMLMREQPQEIVAGIEILLHALQAPRCLIGIEDNKPQAIAALREASAGSERIEVVEVPTLYPTGGERQLIKILTGLEVPSQGLPADIGVVCHNPGTVTAIHDAVHRGRPLVSRIVTVTGQGIRQPQNLRVRIGTPMHALVEHCGGYAEEVHRLLMGGPMMGFALPHDDLPVIKTCNCLLAATREEMPPPPEPQPCIRCAECASVCPAQLLPQQLYWYSHTRDFERVQDYNLFDCIECGCCAYVCPSHLPLVQYYRFAKTEIWNQERERRKADLARQRHEFRQARLEREKRERAERLRKKKKAVQAKAGEADKKAAIQAALERARARKAAAGGTAGTGSGNAGEGHRNGQQRDDDH